MGQRTNLIVEETLIDKEDKFIARKVFCIMTSGVMAKVC